MEPLARGALRCARCTHVRRRPAGAGAACAATAVVACSVVWWAAASLGPGCVVLRGVSVGSASVHTLRVISRSQHLAAALQVQALGLLGDPDTLEERTTEHLCQGVCPASAPCLLLCPCTCLCCCPAPAPAPGPAPAPAAAAVGSSQL